MGNTDVSETTPPGWYPAPHAGNELRYWDGAAWHAAPPFLPADAAAVPPAQGPVRAYGPVPPHAPYGAPPAPYGAPPAGYAPYGGPVLAPSAPQGWAVAALVLGIAAFLSAWIPFLGLLIALTGAVIGVIALVRRQRKALAVTGTVLSGLGLAWALIVSISIGSLIWAPSPSYSDPDAGAAPAPEASPSDRGFEPYAPETGPGSLEDPLPLPYMAGPSSRDEYRADVRLVDEDATDEILGWNAYNERDITGMRYVLVEMTVTGLDPEGIEASYASYDLSVATPDGMSYPSAYVVPPDDTTLLVDQGTIAEGETVEGLVAYLVPEDATDLLLSDYANFYAF